MRANNLSFHYLWTNFFFFLISAKKGGRKQFQNWDKKPIWVPLLYGERNMELSEKGPGGYHWALIISSCPAISPIPPGQYQTSLSSPSSSLFQLPWFAFLLPNPEGTEDKWKENLSVLAELLKHLWDCLAPIPQCAGWCRGGPRAQLLHGLALLSLLCLVPA